MTREIDLVRFVDSGNPTEVINAPWILATCPKKTRSETPRTGKWLLFVPEKYVDETWHNVKKAVEAGKLWKMAKVSIAWLGKGGRYVICVYTL